MDLNENDFNTLVNGYKSERDPERVDYVAFAKEVNKIFTLKDLEYDPTKRLNLME